MIHSLTIGSHAALSASVSNTTIQDELVVPMDCTVLGVNAYATAVAGTAAKPTIDVWNAAGASILSSAITLATAAVYSGTVASPKLRLKRGDILSARVTTCASDGAVTKPMVNIIVRG